MKTKARVPVAVSRENARIVRCSYIGEIEVLQCYDPPFTGQAISMVLTLSHGSVFAAIINDDDREPRYFVDGKRVYPMDAMRRAIEKRNEWDKWRGEHNLTRRAAANG